jgi:hypothetical protein
MAADEQEQLMTRVRVHDFSVSLDGFGAGADQALEHPLGVGGEASSSGRVRSPMP